MELLEIVTNSDFGQTWFRNIAKEGNLDILDELSEQLGGIDNYEWGDIRFFGFDELFSPVPSLAVEIENLLEVHLPRDLTKICAEYEWRASTRCRIEIAKKMLDLGLDEFVVSGIHMYRCVEVVDYLVLTNQFLPLMEKFGFLISDTMTTEEITDPFISHLVRHGFTWK